MSRQEVPFRHQKVWGSNPYRRANLDTVTPVDLQVCRGCCRAGVEDSIDSSFTPHFGSSPRAELGEFGSLSTVTEWCGVRESDRSEGLTCGGGESPPPRVLTATRSTQHGGEEPSPPAPHGRGDSGCPSWS